jgi:hypothetical protein
VVITAISRPSVLASNAWIYGAVAFHVACAIVLAPVASHPYDLAVLTSNAQAWLDWGFSPFYNWKFGSDLTALALLAQTTRAFLASLGLPGIVALHIAWKLPLVGADLLTASSIFRLSQRLAPRRAIPLAALWLLNPVVLWVSAGHGQVESLAVLCTFAGLTLAFEGRLFAAGIATGLGVGIEYFPIAVVGSVLIWWRGGHIPNRLALFSFGTGLALSLSVCYLPVAIDSTARSALAGGLASSTGLTVGSVNSLLSIWPWVAYRFEFFWPFVFVATGLLCLAVGLELAKRGAGVGLIFLAGVLTAALLLDANTLPQFAPVAAAALWLLAIATPVNAILLVLVPAAGLASYFLFLDLGASTANAFFYDDWYATGVQLWAVPVNERVSVVLGGLFSLGLLATVAYALAVGNKAPGWSWALASATSVGLSVAIIVWALQPAIWISAFSIAPGSNPPDFQYATARAAAFDPLGPNVFRIRYPDPLVYASRRAVVQPTGALSVAIADIFDREGADIAKPASEWNARQVTLPNWSAEAQTVRSLWFELRLGSQSWSDVLGPKLNQVSLSVNGSVVSASAAHVAPRSNGSVNWAYVDFEAPSSDVAADGRVTLEPLPGSLIWSGSSAGPWVRVVPASGTMPALTEFHIQDASYRVSPNGLGYLEGFPIDRGFVVDLSSVQTNPPRVDGAVLLWPSSIETWKESTFVRSVGGFFLALVLLITATVMYQQLSRKGLWRARRTSIHQNRAKAS